MSEMQVRLPPREVWLFDPTTEKISTPCDARGFVIVPALIELVDATIDPEYQWPMDRPDIHHFYWYRRWYHGLGAPRRPLRVIFASYLLIKPICRVNFTIGFIESLFRHHDHHLKL